MEERKNCGEDFSLKKLKKKKNNNNSLFWTRILTTSLKPKERVKKQFSFLIVKTQ